MRDFEQIAYDARHWLRTTARPKITISSELANGIGLIRRKLAVTAFLPEPELLFALEHHTLRGNRYGAIVVKVAADSDNQPIDFRWFDDRYVVRSPLVYSPNKLLPLSDLSGMALDRVHERLAGVMSCVLQDIQR
jgi:hypothetical protein